MFGKMQVGFRVIWMNVSHRYTFASKPRQHFSLFTNLISEAVLS
jgi:hypothetical protein